MELVVTSTGLIRSIYDETINLKSLGHVHIRRGSHVEPDELGRWTADLSPVGGPLLGPFEQRCSALAAEIAWPARALARTGTELTVGRFQSTSAFCEAPGLRSGAFFCGFAPF